MKDKILNSIRKELARQIPALSKLESFLGPNNVKLTSARVESDNILVQIDYEVNATPEVYRAFKKSLTNARVIKRDNPITMTYWPCGEKYMKMYFVEERIDVRLKINKRD